MIKTEITSPRLQYLFPKALTCLTGLLLASSFIVLGCTFIPSVVNAAPTEQGQTIPEPKPVNDVPPRPTGLNIYVNDDTGLLTVQDKATLRDRLQALDEAGIAQISVLVLPNTDRELSDFAPEIMNRWDIQHYKKRDGLLVLVNAYRVQNHLSGNRIFVGTGYALEGLLPDVLIGRVLDEQALPAFDNGQTSQGVTNATLTLAKILSGDKELHAKYTQNPADDVDPGAWIIFILVVLFVIYSSRKNRPGGGGGFYGGGFGGGGFYGGGSGGGFDGGFGGGGDSSGGGGSGR